MTSPLPRKPRTTARRTPAGTGFSLAVAAALLTAGPAAAQGPVARQAAQPPAQPPPVIKQTPQERAKLTTLPDRSEIFVLRDDAQTERRIMELLRQTPEYKKAPQTIEPSLRFPPSEEPGMGMAYVPKTGSYAPSECRFEARYVVHRRLFFEEKNAERYGWDLGYIQPLVSTAYFFRDVLLLPNSVASGFAYGFWDTNAGKCLPGSPTPYLLYPPGLTITGTAAEGAIITGLSFAFP